MSRGSTHKTVEDRTLYSNFRQVQLREVSGHVHKCLCFGCRRTSEAVGRDCSYGLDGSIGGCTMARMRLHMYTQA